MVYTVVAIGFNLFLGIESHVKRVVTFLSFISVTFLYFNRLDHRWVHFPSLLGHHAILDVI